MEYLLGKLIFLSLAGTAAVGLAWIAVCIGRSRLPKHWSYYIWLLPLLAFVLPISGFQPALPALPEEFPVYQDEVVILPEQPELQTTQAAAPVQENLPETPVKQPAATPVSAPKHGWTAELWQMAAMVVWISGILCIICYRTVLRTRFVRRLRVICEPPNAAAAQIFARVCAEMDVKKPPAFWQVHAEVTPFITGIRRPQIVMPDTVTETELALALRHELVHYKRRDLFYRAAVYAVSAIHWFNPAVYVMRRLMEREMELSCDEAALVSMEYEQRRQYGLSVLMLMKRNRNVVPGTAFLSERGQDMRKRMEGIMNKKVYGLWAKISAAVLAAVMVCSTTALSAGIHSANPVKNTFGVNYDASIGDFSYRMETPDGEVLSGETGRGSARIRASLVNTPLQKSFYASVEIPEYRLYGMTAAQEHRDAHMTIVTNETKDTIAAQAEIRMDKLLSIVNDGRNWFGTFTVTLNDKPVMEQAYGVLSDVPCANQKELTSLEVYDDTAGKLVTLNTMRFDMGGETLLEGAKADGEVRTAFYEHTENRKTPLCKITSLSLPQDACPWFGEPQDMTDKEFAGIFYYNTALGKLDLTESVPGTPYGIATELTDDFTFDGNRAHGRFFVMWHNRIAAEFTGTISGLDGSAGDTLRIQSDDGAYSVELAFTETDPPTEVTIPAEAPAATPGEAFRRDAEQQWQHIVTADFPFTITLNPDKKSVTLVYKEDSGFEGWTASMATYPSRADAPYIWEDISSNQGQNTFTFSLLDTGERHYINFSAYNTLPNAKVTEGELSFKLLDGELFYTNGTKNTYTHPALAGADALPYIMDFCSPLQRLLR